MKKKVKFNHAIAGESFSYRAGEVSEPIDESLANAWIASGVAKPAEEDPADLKKQIAELQERLKSTEKK